MKFKLYFLLFFSAIVLLIACDKEEEKSKLNDITSFIVTGQLDSTSINKELKEITITLNSTTDLKSITTDIKLSAGAKVEPASGTAVDFSEGSKVFTVTAEDGTKQEWKVILSLVYPNLDGRQINTIVFDKNDTKWIGTNEGLFKSIEKGYALMEITVSGKVTSLSYDEKNNNLWIGTEEGLAKASILNGFSASKIDNANLSNSNVTAVHVDANSNSWIGSILGLSLMNKDSWKKTGIVEETEEFKIDTLNISSIANNGDDYYFASKGRRVIHAYGFDESLDAFSGASLLLEPYNGEALVDTMFVVFCDSKGRQWMAGTNGVQWHADVNIKMDGLYYNELPSNKVHAIAEAPNGDIWVGTENGIAVFNDVAWSVLNIELPDPFVNAIAFDKTGTAWIGTNKGLTSSK